MNAFATGPSKKRSLVAVSTGLLRAMGRPEIEGVLGHEVTHVANGDMVTMTLIQGVVNAFVLYFAHLVAALVRGAVSGRDEQGRSSGFLGFLVGQVVFIAAQIAFGLLGSLITAWFSRHREFRADAGGAALAGRGSMIAALRRLQENQARVDDAAPQLATFKINGRPKLMMLLATHPPLEQRIAALEKGGAGRDPALALIAGPARRGCRGAAGAPGVRRCGPTPRPGSSGSRRCGRSTSCGARRFSPRRRRRRGPSAGSTSSSWPRSTRASASTSATRPPTTSSRLPSTPRRGRSCSGPRRRRWCGPTLP